MLKALVFDFDGVIVDTERVWFDIYRDWLARDYGYDLKLADYLVCVGATSQALFDFLATQLDLRDDPRSFERRAKEEFVSRSRDLPPLPGVIDLVRQARAAGLKLAIATSATSEKPTFHLKRLGIWDCFDALSCADVFAHPKPAPDAFLTAAEMLGLPPGECLAIEDSGNGLTAAHRAGMPCLVVPNEITAGDRFDAPYARLGSLADFDLATIRADFDRNRKLDASANRGDHHAA